MDWQLRFELQNQIRNRGLLPRAPYIILSCIISIHCLGFCFRALAPRLRPKSQQLQRHVPERLPQPRAPLPNRAPLREPPLVRRVLHPQRLDRLCPSVSVPLHQQPPPPIPTPWREAEREARTDPETDGRLVLLPRIVLDPPEVRVALEHDSTRGRSASESIHVYWD